MIIDQLTKLIADATLEPETIVDVLPILALYLTYNPGIAFSFLTGWRLWFFQFLVLPWTVLMAYSRPILRVHSPLDITVGGLLGIVFGVAAFVLARAVLKRIGRKE